MVTLATREPSVNELADPERFRAFYTAALPRVYGYFAHRVGGDAALAEDLTQETFLAAVRELRRGAPVAEPLPWLIGIARHKWLDHLRRQRRSSWTLLSWEDDVGDTTPFTVGDGDVTHDRAAAALAMVPSPQREALLLRYLDGLSVPEVAAALGRSVSATESLLARARVTVRRSFQEDADGN